MSIIDFHCHVLPGIDDGSKSVRESIRIMESSAEQDVDVMIATPHFHANAVSPARFLSARDKAEKQLSEAVHDVSGTLPSVIPGAEVTYFYGMQNCRELRELCIRGTDLILIEMPFEPWSDSTVRDLLSMRDMLGVRPILAHIERYLGLQKHSTLEYIRENGIYMQSNASFFLHLWSREKAIRMLTKQQFRLIGSDCHNMTTRHPDLQEAYDFIRKRCGEEMTERIKAFSRSLIANAEKMA